MLDSTPSVFDYPVEAFSRFATVVESHMGGTSGALYSLFFEAIATQLFAIDQKEITAQRPLVSRCVRAATEKIMEYGGARKGERTMVRGFPLSVTEDGRKIGSDLWRIIVAQCVSRKKCS